MISLPPAVAALRRIMLKLPTGLLPHLVLIITLLTTAIVWNMIDDGFLLEARHDFHDNSEEIVTELVERLHSHEEALRGGVGLFKVTNDVTREQWREYVSSQQFNRALPGILGVGYATWLPRTSKESYTRKIRAEGFPEYRITPVGKRPVYTAVTYLEPFTWPNRLSFGYDMYTEANRRAAMSRARDEGATSLATGIILVQECGQEKQFGFLMYLPVYRQGLPTLTREQRRGAIKGFVYSPIRVKEFVYGTLGKLPADISFEIFDGNSPQQDKLRFSSLACEKTLLPADYRPTLTRRRTIDLYGRTMTLEFKSLPSFDKKFNRSSSLAVLFAGILLSLLLSGIAQMLQATRDKALSLAREMTQELRESEEKVRLILHTAGEAIYGIDVSGCCTFANPTCFRFLGYQREQELLGKNIHALIHHSHADGTAYPHEECLVFRTVNSGIGCHVDNEVYWRRDGTSFPVEYWSIPQKKDGRVVGAVVSFLDITVRRRDEATLREQATVLVQKEKMASLGQLAAGVAHEINNPMGFITMNLSVMAKYFGQMAGYERILRGEYGKMAPETEKLLNDSRESLDIEFILADGVELIAATLRGADRVTKIVGEMKSFSRMKPEEKEPTDLNSCVESALTIALNELKYLATIRKEYGRLPEVVCNPSQMDQVFLNLLVNAGHAIVSHGEILLRSWHDETSVYASVGDNGQGIPEGIRDRLFEPFFTTKAVGKGTGLGLSISYDIVKKHGGTILVESKVGVGTTFTVILPRAPKER